jgi:hypothetical protein
MAKTINFPILRDDNPYYYGLIFVFPDGSLSLDRQPINYVASPNDRYYTVSDGENLSDISYLAYGSSKWWWVIADVNKLFFPFDLEIGITLVIPDLDALQINNL